MATFQAALTPTADKRPAVAKISAKELSGVQWTRRYPGSHAVTDLTAEFQKSVAAFKSAMESAGMHVRIASTYRPKERSYLMHWCWKIKHGADPAKVPPMAGVPIEWVHATKTASVDAAKTMVTAYDMDGLHVAPALHSLHNDRQAIDMKISWTGDIEIKDIKGNTVKITTEPRSGMNADLKKVGASYSVIKYVGGASDKPHWSTTGH